MTSIAVVDANGDGKPDIVTSNDADTVSLLLGNGDGALQPAADDPAGDRPERVISADANADHRPDLIVINNGGDAARILFGRCLP